MRQPSSGWLVTGKSVNGEGKSLTLLELCANQPSLLGFFFARKSAAKLRYGRPAWAENTQVENN
jgi:hypothetical protein